MGGDPLPLNAPSSSLGGRLPLIQIPLAGCGLGNVMKTRDGEPLSGGASAATDFDGVGTAVAPAPAYGYPQQPAPAYGYPQQPAAPAYPQQPAAPTYPQQPAQGVRINPITGQPM